MTDLAEGFAKLSLNDIVDEVDMEAETTSISSHENYRYYEGSDEDEYTDYKFESKKELIERCYECIKMCDEAESKKLDKTSRILINYKSIPNYKNPATYTLKCTVSFDDLIETKKLSDLGYDRDKNLTVSFFTTDYKDKRYNDVELQGTISFMAFFNTNTEIKLLDLNIDFDTTSIDCDIDDIFEASTIVYVIPSSPDNMLHENVGALEDHLEYLWEQDVGRALLDLLVRGRRRDVISNTNIMREDAIPKYKDKQLNKEQYEALNLAIDGHPICYIQAPPGTGKTVVCAMIANSLPNEKIFLTTETNKAADNLAECCWNSKQDGNRLIRYFAKSAESKLIQLPCYAENIIKDNLSKVYRHQLTCDQNDSLDEYQELKNYMSNYENRRRLGFGRVAATRKKLALLEGVRNEILAQQYNPNIIVTTSNYGKRGLRNKLNRDEIRRVIVDEAGQMTVCGFIQLAGFFPNASFTLVGDINQLPPFVPCDCIPVNSKCNILFESILKLVSDSRMVPFKNLITSYRMHPVLLDLVSKSFYNDTLVSGVKASERLLVIEKLALPVKSYPMAWLDTIGCLATLSLKTSYENKKEAEYVTKFVMNLLRIGFDGDQIGVICMYKGQVKYISSLLRDSLVTVNTVDGFQGNEREVIIICTTRTSSRSYNGYPNQCTDFLGDPFRINVAISRAKSCLIIFGDIEYLEKNSHWSGIINYFREKEAVGNAADFSKIFSSLAQ
uniref:AAA_12 domain-containing protein n=1 Tax=Rhabditophanes sp. KR3021 TaxID=114890 RepID=A0AC35UH61_9BILA